uniref:Uncharacterized protein n=1 Tax=Setaria digitata TaxID=48799 RepID=A0A915PMD5_9BILA
MVHASSRVIPPAVASEFKTLWNFPLLPRKDKQYFRSDVLRAGAADEKSGEWDDQLTVVPKMKGRRDVTEPRVVITLRRESTPCYKHLFGGNENLKRIGGEDVSFYFLRSKVRGLLLVWPNEFSWKEASTAVSTGNKHRSKNNDSFPFADLSNPFSVISSARRESPEQLISNNWPVQMSHSDENPSAGISDFHSEATDGSGCRQRRWRYLRKKQAGTGGMKDGFALSSGTWAEMDVPEFPMMA